MENGVILEGINLSHSFKRHRVLNQINCHFEKNSITVIRGQSGSGKSTLLQILSGLERPEQGSVLYKKQNIHKLNEKQQSAMRGQNIGFIFQAFHLIPDLTVEQNILLPLKINALHIENNILINLCEKLKIRHLMKEKARFLSGGEKQRVAIARALIKRPTILFADEPTGNLDATNSIAIVEIIEQLVVEDDLTAIIVTHDEKLFKNPSRTLELINGKLIELETNV